MALSKLNVANFRNFEQLNLQFQQQTNFIVGANGSGKTSLLEAIYYLSHGRSFNTKQHGKVIRFEQGAFVVSAEVLNQAGDIEYKQRLGLQRQRDGEVQIRVDGENQKRVSALAKLLPVQLITPDSFKLFFGGPKERRQFFDFGLFHVKQSYYADWLRFSKIQRHRNALLKQRPSKYNQEFDYWDQEFCRLATIISENRQQYLALFQAAYEQTKLSVDSFLTDADVSFQLSAGYNQQQDLHQQLKQGFARDVKFGYTAIGPHKSDIKIKTQGRLVEDVFSRGQLKLLLYVIKLLQSNIISENQLAPIMLIDDIGSEVDQNNLQTIYKFLQLAKQTQFFITSLDNNIADTLSAENECYAVFHVKHGTIK